MVAEVVSLFALGSLAEEADGYPNENAANDGCHNERRDIVGRISGWLADDEEKETGSRE